MKRTELGVGAKSRERGRTFASEPKPLKRSPMQGETSGRRSKPSFTPASAQQRRKVADMPSLVSGQRPCDPCHLTKRQHGGCDHEDCVLPLTRAEHIAFDDGDLDILPDLIAKGCWVELAHAVLVHHFDPIALANRCTGDYYVPEKRTP